MLTWPLQLSILLHPLHQPEIVPLLPFLGTVYRMLQLLHLPTKISLCDSTELEGSPSIPYTLIFLFSHKSVSAKMVKSVVYTQADYTSL